MTVLLSSVCFPSNSCDLGLFCGGLPQCAWPLLVLTVANCWGFVSGWLFWRCESPFSGESWIFIGCRHLIGRGRVCWCAGTGRGSLSNCQRLTLRARAMPCRRRRLSRGSMCVKNGCAGQRLVQRGSPIGIWWGRDGSTIWGG